MTTDLIRELESAEEGSRELDCRIEYALKPHDGIPSGDPNDPPHYTTSIDAALTLVPEGWAAHQYDPPLYGAKSAHAYLYPPGNEWHEKRELIAAGYAPSRALALCIAALKAREMGE